MAAGCSKNVGGAGSGAGPAPRDGLGAGGAISFSSRTTISSTLRSPDRARYSLYFLIASTLSPRERKMSASDLAETRFPGSAVRTFVKVAMDSVMFPASR